MGMLVKQFGLLVNPLRKYGFRATVCDIEGIRFRMITSHRLFGTTQARVGRGLEIGFQRGWRCVQRLINLAASVMIPYDHVI